MSQQADIAAARSAFLDTFAWHRGHADIWPAFADGPTLAAVVDGLAAPWRDQGITHVVGVEARGFLLGGAVAVRLGVGFVAVRKSGALFPGGTLTATTGRDYRGLEHELRMQDVLGPDDVVLLVDDWAQTGSQAVAVQSLVHSGGARLAGLSLLVDQLDDDVRAGFGRVTALVRAEEVGDPD
ncbi:MAG: phosphoribosyltransferase family protein [Motilibacteraceae bacterium]